jgi:hypothetical protein
MAKKSRRARRRAKPAAQPVRPTRPVAQAKSKEVDFAAEYSYVIDDLRRIGITAAALMALLIALALIIS